MAICISHLFAGMRGSIAGVTYFTTGAGQIIARQRTHPVNPQTNPQSLIRSMFSYSVSQWEGLDDSVRALWQGYADSLGTGQSGRSVFIANYTLAQHLQFINGEAIGLSTAAPTDPGALPIARVEPQPYTAEGIGICVLVENANDYDIAIIANISRQFGSARQRLQGPFLSAGAQVEANAGPDITTFTFDGLVEDGVYFVKVRAVAKSPHTVSADYIIRCVAVENVLP